jgi:putative ABC transport system permease protein
MVDTEFRRDDSLRVIDIRRPFETPVDESAIPPEELAVPPGVSGPRRERVRQYLVRRWRARQPAGEPWLSGDDLDAAARVPHVERVVPLWHQLAEVTVDGEPRPAGVGLVPPGRTSLDGRIVFGRLPDPDQAEMALPEALLVEWGVVEDAAVERFLGRSLKVDIGRDDGGGAGLLQSALGLDGPLTADERRALAAAADKLPELLDALDLRPAEKRLVEELRRRGRPGAPERVAAAFTVVGVFRPPDRRGHFWDVWGGDNELMIAVKAGRALLERRPRTAPGYPHATVTVDDPRHLRAATEELERRGFQCASLLEAADRAMREVALIGGGMAALSVLALVVAGLGIANTMATSVLERTRDIGVMKAVGARDRHVLGMFLAEGAALGLAGGLAGMGLARLAAWVADAWVRRAVEQISGEQVAGPVFLFPAWLLAGVPAFALAVTAAAALAPARRAARTDPAATLRS